MALFNSVKVLLFDLDNTLLFMDENNFVLSYATNLAKYFSDVFGDPKVFIHHLLEGTNYMVATKSQDMNIAKFFQYFIHHCNGLYEEIVYDRFLNFYTHEFDNVKNIVVSTHLAPKIIEKALHSNLEIVIATNPIFPEIATRKRLELACLGNFIDKLLLVTYGEQFNTTKPDINYYKQILEKTEHTAEEFLIVGIDIYNDVVASLIGMKFFYISSDINVKEADFLSKEAQKRVDIKAIKIAGKGTLEDFYNMLSER